VKTLALSLKVPVLVSSLLVLPLIALEIAFNQLPAWSTLSGERVLDFAVLFGALWLLPLGFTWLATPLVQDWRAGRPIGASPWRRLITVAALGLIAVIWAAILLDQFPCFLGIPNCD